MATGEGGCTVSKVTKSFGATRVLGGVDIVVPRGKFGVLVGPSGCGKSTLLRILAGLENADSGAVHIAGRDVTHEPPRSRDIAMVFQSYALYPHLSVRDNLAFGLRLRGEDEAEIARRTEQASSMLGLGPLLDRLPKQLSGGQRQRVAMGRAIVRRAPLFLFDEPLSNLDAALRAEVRVQIRKLHDELDTTTVYVTHDQVEAMTLADLLFVLNKGQVEQSGPPLEVFARPASVFVAKFLGSPPMNLFEGATIDAGRARNATLTLPVHEARYGQVAEGRAVTVGVRPHELRVVDDDTPGVAGEVQFVERLGSESFVHVQIAGNAVIVRLDAGQEVGPAGSPLRLTARAEHVHLFDAQSGRALDLLGS